VFAREFFTKDQRSNLPQVPACPKCNGKKGELEHYATGVLPLLGRHADAAANLSLLYPRLEKNAKLRRETEEKKEKVWVKQDGLFLPTMKIPFDSAKRRKLFRFIVKGLMWYHWEVLLMPEDFVDAKLLAKEEEDKLWTVFCMQTNKRVKESLGAGTVR